MKKFLTFMAFALMSVCALTLASCSDDDDNDGPTNNAIVGTWEMVSRSGTLPPLSEMAEPSKYTQFQKDGKYIEVYEEGGVNRGTWTLSGDKLRMAEEITQIPIEFTVKFNGKDSFEASWQGMVFKFKRVDDSVIEPYLKETSAGQIKVNGKVWELSKDDTPTYGGVTSTGLIHNMKFCKKEADINSLMFPDYVELYFEIDNGKAITKGLDLAKTPMIHGTDYTQCELSEGYGMATMEEKDCWYASIYDNSKPISGSAVVVDIKEGDFITVKFSNYKLPRMEDTVYDLELGDSKPQPETLTLDGTVTFKYED